eukprot:6425412-Ditylum_brightwellii.AAC.1
MGNTSLAAVDKAMYSDFVVLRAISDCNLLNHVMGQLLYMMTQPDLDLTPLGSSRFSFAYAPASLHLHSNLTLLSLGLGR